MRFRPGLKEVEKGEGEENHAMPVSGRTAGQAQLAAAKTAPPVFHIIRPPEMAGSLLYYYYYYYMLAVFFVSIGN